MVFRRRPVEGVELNRSFWKGRRVLVTGHTGFKGSWLTLWLNRMGAEVFGLALEPATTPDLYRLASVGSSNNSTIGDIRDREVVRRAVEAASPGVIFHLAAQPLVRQSYQEPSATFATNVLGTAHLLDAARESGVRAIVVITTDKCYLDENWPWPYRESDRLGGRDPYAASKACAELVTASFRDSYLAQQGIGVATARAGNVIGAGDWSQDRLLPDLVGACARGDAVVLRRPSAVRPWQHVLDPLHGYLLLAERLAGDAAAFSAAWNFGPQPDSFLSVHEIAERVVNLWGSGAIRIADDAGAHETHALRLDSSKAGAQLRWHPLLDLEETLRWTVDGYKQLAAGAGREIIDRQIESFEDRLNESLPVL